MLGARDWGKGERRLSGVVGRLLVYGGCGVASNMIGVLTTGKRTVIFIKVSTSAQLKISSPRVKAWFLLSIVLPFTWLF